MQHAEFESLQNMGVRDQRVTSDLLCNKTPRTLLLGYNSDRLSLHVYLDESRHIHGLEYAELSPEISGVKALITRHAVSWEDFKANAEYRTSKRLYPESCDLEFCSLLKRAGALDEFVPLDEARHENRLARWGTGFAGPLLDGSSVFAGRLIRGVASACSSGMLGDPPNEDTIRDAALQQLKLYPAIAKAVRPEEIYVDERHLIQLVYEVALLAMGAAPGKLQRREVEHG